MIDRIFPPAYRALIVDDHEISRQYTVAALRQVTVAVKQTGCAREALDIAGDWSPDVVIVDFHLPEMTGLQLARRIVDAWPKHRVRPLIIALSADPDACGAGAGVFDRVLRKPAQTGRLIEAIAPGENRFIREDGPRTDPRLAGAFRRELFLRLPELDSCLSRFDLDPASQILHKLTASCTLCGALELRNKVRKLDSDCRGEAEPGKLARHYFSLVLAVKEYLVAAGPAEPRKT